MKRIYLIAFIFLLASCMRLDSFMFNSSKVDSYKLDAYEGEVDFILDETYDIPDSLVHLFYLETKEEKFKIYAIYIGSIDAIQTDTVIMYCHGNKDHMDFYWQRAKLLAHTGGKNHFGVLMIDDRGFGMSEGEASQEYLVEDASLAMEWLKEKGLTSERLIIYGFSMGTYPSIYHAANYPTLKPSKLITEAPYASSDVMAQDASGLALPGSYVSSSHFDNAENIKNVTQPYLWIHGKADDFLSIKTHGEVVFKNYSGVYGQAERIDGADHSSVPQTIGFEGYNKLLEEFIER